MSTHKNLCVYQANNVVFTHQFPWVHRDFPVSTECAPFTATFSWLAKISCVLIDFSVSTQSFLVSACVKSFISWESYFLDKNMFTISSSWFDSVFGTTFNWLSAEPKWVCYKTKLHHDRWGQLLVLIYTQKFQKAHMSILDDAKSYYVKNSSVNSVIICIHMNILKMNFWIFLY